MRHGLEVASVLQQWMGHGFSELQQQMGHGTTGKMFNGVSSRPAKKQKQHAEPISHTGEDWDEDMHRMEMTEAAEIYRLTEPMPNSRNLLLLPMERFWQGEDRSEHIVPEAYTEAPSRMDHFCAMIFSQPVQETESKQPPCQLDVLNKD